MRIGTRSSLLVVIALALGSHGKAMDGGAGVDGGTPAGQATNAAAPAKAATKAQPELIQSNLPAWLQFSVQARGRLEAPFGVGYVPDSSDVYYLSRLRFDLGVRPTKWLRFFAQAQDSRAIGYDLGPKPASMFDPIDLRQAYVEIGGVEATPACVRVGRQEMQFGGGRLVSASEWSNTGRTFDAARLSLSASGVKADFFGGSVIQPDSNRFDRHKPGDHLYGTYIGLGRLMPQAVVEPYFLVKTNLGVNGEHGDLGNAHVYTSGFRVAGRLPARFDYSTEIAHQWGFWAADGISATAGYHTLGWTAVPRGWRPRLSTDITHASGDGTYKDGNRNTFDQLYGGLHSQVGVADQVGWRNIRNYKAGVDVTPTRKLKASVDFRELYLASTQDGLYNSSGTRVVLNRKATSTHVGSELDLQASYVIQGATITAGWGRLFAGQYLKQSSKGSGYSFPFLMWLKRF